MARFKITKNGFFTKEYDPDTDLMAEQVVQKLTPHILDVVVEIEKDVTLKDILMNLYQYESEVNDLFFAYTWGIKLRPFIDDLENKFDDSNNPITEIHVQREYSITKREDDNLNAVTELNEDFRVNGRMEGSDDTYAIDFCTMGDIKNAMIVLREDVCISYMNTIYEEKKYKDKGSDPEFIRVDKKEFTFQEFIGAILSEITFHGYPDNRQKRLDEVKESLEEVENGNAGLGEVFLQEEITLQTEEMRLKRLLSEEKYEQAEKVKERIEDIKKDVRDKMGEDYKIKRLFDF